MRSLLQLRRRAWRGRPNPRRSARTPTRRRDFVLIILFCLSQRERIYRSPCLSACLLVCLLACQSVTVSVSVSVSVLSLSVCLSFCLFLYMSPTQGAASSKKLRSQSPIMPTKENEKCEYMGCTITSKVSSKKWVVRVPARCAKAGREFSVDRVFGAHKALAHMTRARSYDP